MKTLALVVVVALSLVGMTILRQPKPDGPEPYISSEVQAAAIQHLILCAPDYLMGRNGQGLARINRIKWRKMPQRRIMELLIRSNLVLEGLTIFPDTVEINPLYREDPLVVAHEMLHIAIGKPGHDYTAFAACDLL